MYALLCNYASDSDRCWPSHATLAARLSCSVSSVKKYLSELVGEKLICVKREQYRSCVYYMLRPDGLEESKEVSRKPEIDRQQPKAVCIQPEIGYLNTLNKQEEKTTPPITPVPVSRRLPPASGSVGSGGSFSHDFEKAWEAYPKKEAMGLARYAWGQLRQNGQLPPISDLLTAIKRFTFTGSWQREHGRFIPQMSNFLRGQRWLDVLPPEEEHAAQQRLETAKADAAWKQEQENLKARNKEHHARLAPVYEAFKAKFPAEELSDGRESMLRGTWLYLHAKYGGPTAADVPDGNTLSLHDFMKAYQRRRNEEAYLAARAVRDFQADNREEKFVRCSEVLRQPIFGGRAFAAA